MSGETQMVFSATTTTVISHAAVLNNAANTYAGMTGFTQLQLDNSTDLYPEAKCVLSITDTFAAAPTAGGTIDLYMTEDDIDGTADETPEPGATDIVYLGKYVGSFLLDNQDVATIKPLLISLKGVKKARFNVLNSSGQQISYTSTPMTVKIQPFSWKAAA